MKKSKSADKSKGLKILRMNESPTEYSKQVLFKVSGMHLVPFSSVHHFKDKFAEMRFFSGLAMVREDVSKCMHLCRTPSIRAPSS